MNAYFDALLGGGDYAQYFTEDVSWTTVETGEHLHGRQAVRDYIVAFHTRIFDAHPEPSHVGIADGYAFAEADFVGTQTAEFAGIAPTGAPVRVPYTMAYDVNETGITALRAYIPIAQIVAQLQAAAGDTPS